MGSAYSTLFEPPQLPSIVSEWAALIPLVCHLASHRHDHDFVGELALLGRVSIGLFPKLGTLSSIARLLQGGPDLLDRASSRGGSESIVWDVRWGSEFPCANGAAASLVAGHAISNRKISPRIMPDRIPVQGLESTGTGHHVTSTKEGDHQMNDASPSPEILRPVLTTSSPHRRYQTLNIIHVERQPSSHSLWTRLSIALSSGAVQLLVFVLLLGTSVILALSKLNGTAIIICSSAISQLLLHQVRIVGRPPGYLASNEPTQETGSMLVAVHANASAWYLFHGDRGVIDGILNKSMINIEESPSMKSLSLWFKIAHLLQLLGMTYVAAQKGWDGVALVLSMLMSAALRLRHRKTRLVDQWMECEGIRVNSHTYKFTGRMIMLGAVQLLTGSKTVRWMDSIMVGCPRRDAWLQLLDPDLKTVGLRELADRDKAWVALAADLGRTSAEIIRQDLLLDARL